MGIIGHIDQPEEATRRVRQHAVERLAEARPGQQKQGKRAQRRKLRLVVEVGQGEEEDHRRAKQHPPDGDLRSAGVGQSHVLVGGQFGDQRAGQRQHPRLSAEDEQDDDEDQKSRGEDSFHWLS
jgi:hypothetical protein